MGTRATPGVSRSGKPSEARTTDGQPFPGRAADRSKKANNTTHKKELWAVNMLVPSQQGQPELSADDRIQILTDKLEKMNRKLELLTGFK